MSAVYGTRFASYHAALVSEKEACDELHDDDFNCGVSNQWVCRYESLEVLGVRGRSKPAGSHPIGHQASEPGVTTVPRLLVVEDDPDQSRMLCDRLKLYGYAVACANDGPAALEMLEADSYHGVLLDLNLPTMPGHRVLEQARQSWPHLPVLVMSASQNGIRTLKEADPTACTYLVKPYNSSELKQALVKSFGPRPESI